MAREPGRLACSAESILREEPVLGTASRVRRWLLVEQPGPWGRDALLESRMEERVARTLQSRARRSGVRVVLLRRPRWAEAGPRRAYLVHTAPSARWIEQLEVDDDGLLDLDLGVLALGTPPGVGRAVAGSVRLVCTNGRHDPCCADEGRPVMRALADEGLDEVWESSHVGGDRFAANVVFLPTGVFYGRVPAERAAELIRDHDRGLLHLDHYRGRCSLPPMTQAAEIFLRRELGERGLDALRPVESTPRGDDATTVVLERGEERYWVHAGREKGDPEHLTCSDRGLSRPWRYRLLGWGPLAGPESDSGPWVAQP